MKDGPKIGSSLRRPAAEVANALPAGTHRSRRMIRVNARGPAVEGHASVGNAGPPEKMAKVTNASVGNAGTPESHQKQKQGRKRRGGTNDDDVFEIGDKASYLYYNWSVHTLRSEFPKVTLPSIKHVLKHHKKRFEPAYKALYHAQYLAPGASGTPDWLHFHKSDQVPGRPPREPCPFFAREYARVKAKLPTVINLDAEEASEPPPPMVNSDPGPSSDIECGCCFVDHPFDQMAQCADGHLFCLRCLQRHVEEATFGGGQSFSLPCMDTSGCTEFFPWSEVERALPPEVLQKYEKRVAEESVARAQLAGLVYCPFCSYPCEVDPELRNLECPSCHKASCIECKEPDHLPLKCEEVEKKGETSIRRHIEELMTKALIRECRHCKAELVKADGCNKIRCRCGRIMCYICRNLIADYTHFCQHPREPGKPCKVCEKCGLWDKEEEDVVVKAAKEAAMKEAAAKEPKISSRKIGPDDHQPVPSQKKAKRTRR